jgi:hypothetical protein
MYVGNENNEKASSWSKIRVPSVAIIRLSSNLRNSMDERFKK